jgi:pentatricopeptide repeat protein
LSFYFYAQVSMWMTDKRYFDLSFRDVAIRLDLIAKVHGIEEVENFFNNIPVKLKVLEVYSALLNCYAYVKNVEKAEAVMQKMKDLGLDKTVVAYNVLLNLYHKTGNHEKLDALMHEMEEKGFNFDRYTFGIRLSAYAAASDVEGIDKILRKMESNPSGVLDWTSYAVAASGYTKTGLVEKALEMLKKSEGLVTSKRRGNAFNFLLTQYAAIGKKDEVLRLWELYKKKEKKIYSKGYMSVITSLLKFDDIDSAEKIFNEWDSRQLNYDIRVPNYLMGAFCRKGLMEKAETLVNQVMVKGGRPNARMNYFLATGYLQINQYEKGVEAMKKAILVCGPWWKPSEKSLAACLEYLKTKGDVEAAEELIRLLRDKNIVSVDIYDRLVNYIKDSESSLPALDEMGGDASIGNGETIGFSEFKEDSGKLYTK